MSLPALYQISDQYLIDLEKLSELDLDDQTIADTLESIQGDMQEKCTNVAMWIRNTEALADQIKQAEEAMASRRKALERRAESIRTYLQHNMQRCGITKIESPWFQISIRKNPPSVVVDDPSLIPADLMRQPEPPPPAPDKKAIKEALTNGFAVPGARLETTERVQIK